MATVQNNLGALYLKTQNGSAGRSVSRGFGAACAALGRGPSGYYRLPDRRRTGAPQAGPLSGVGGDRCARASPSSRRNWATITGARGMRARHLGMVLTSQGRFDEAEQELNEARRVMLVALGAQHPRSPRRRRPCRIWPRLAPRTSRYTLYIWPGPNPSRCAARASRSNRSRTTITTISPKPCRTASCTSSGTRSSRRPETMRAEIDRRLGLQEKGSMLPFAVIDNDSRQGRRHDDLHEHRRRQTTASKSARPGIASSVQRSSLNTQCKLLLLDACVRYARLHRRGVPHALLQSARAGAPSSGSARKLDGILRNHQRASDGTLRDTVRLQHHRKRMADGALAPQLAAREAAYSKFIAPSSGQRRVPRRSPRAHRDRWRRQSAD